LYHELFPDYVVEPAVWQKIIIDRGEAGWGVPIYTKAYQSYEKLRYGL
jgi:hypothetical protein